MNFALWVFFLLFLKNYTFYNVVTLAICPHFLIRLNPVKCNVTSQYRNYLEQYKRDIISRIISYHTCLNVMYQNGEHLFHNILLHNEKKTDHAVKCYQTDLHN